MSIISKIKANIIKCDIQRKVKKYKIMLGKEVTFNGDFIYKGKAEKVSIGSDTVINSGEELVPVGYSNKTSFWIIKNGSITIGEHCGITNTAICSEEKICIGNHVLMGSGCKIYDTDFHSIDALERRDIVNNPGCRTASVTIEDDVFLGAGVTVLKGTHIGVGAVIGAGSVVSGDVPSRQIWAGNPARFIRDI